MSQEEQQEHIEQHGKQRFKFIGGRIVAVEVVCFDCRQMYWQYVMSCSSHSSPVHQCNPSSQAGASVIDKFG